MNKKRFGFLLTRTDFASYGAKFYNLRRRWRKVSDESAKLLTTWRWAEFSGFPTHGSQRTGTRHKHDTVT